MMEPNNPLNNPVFRAVYLSNITVIQNFDLAVDLAMDMNLALNPPRWCQRCGVFETPLWRTGPLGPKTLCNACGLRYKKENKQVDTTLSLGSLNSKMPGNYYTKST